MTTAVLEPDVADPDQELEDGKEAHIVVPAWKVTEAYATGSPVVALCGFSFVPSRDPKKYPQCPRCEEILTEAACRGRGHEPR